MPEREEQFPDDVMSRMLASIDHPVPPFRANNVIQRARTRSARRTVMLAAAGVILAASVATAAMPGSYARIYLRRLLLGERASASVTPGSKNNGAADAAARGIAFAPGARVDVDFRTEQPLGTLEVRWGDVSSVTLSQPGSSGDAHYGLTPDGVIVDNVGSVSNYSLVLPRTLARARVRIAGREVFTKSADGVSCAGVQGEGGSCVIDVTSRHRSLEHGAP